METLIGVFGGTFDPPHIGHLVLAAEAQAQLNLARILWVLTPYPPHKENRAVTPLQDRLALLRATLGDDPLFELSTIDIDRPPPHYAVDTLRLLKGRYPSAGLVYLMGGDSLANLLEWHDPVGFVGACDALGVMARPQRLLDIDALQAQLSGLSEKLRLINSPLLEISSTLVRERIARRQPFRYFLPEAVYYLIREQGLYGYQ
ncbi:MAG: nicotinate (nicotinamide) nucleotide adenylyltransferase [Anaerolineales bacterium]|nr:nicotinate (nicotinamide) nucleotide adenylyltransferase [Anaerolineales bacterium]